MSTETLIALLVALGVGGLAREILTGLIGWITGRQDRERTALRQAYADLDEARDDLDTEMAYRRRVVEHAHALRRQLLDHGIEPTDPFPARTHPKETP